VSRSNPVSRREGRRGTFEHCPDARGWQGKRGFSSANRPFAAWLLGDGSSQRDPTATMTAACSGGVSGCRRVTSRNWWIPRSLEENCHPLPLTKLPPFILVRLGFWGRSFTILISCLSASATAGADSVLAGNGSRWQSPARFRPRRGSTTPFDHTLEWPMVSRLASRHDPHGHLFGHVPTECDTEDRQLPN